MKEFLLILRRFIPPYKKYLVLTVLFNILSAVLNIFSFAALIPILQILFRTEGTGTATHLMPWTLDNIKEVMANNADYYVTQLIGNVGATTTLLLIGLFLAFTTFLKTGAYFLSSATIIPIRTGVVLVMSWMMVFVTGKGAKLREVPKGELGFICLSGLATGASWLCYYYAIQNGVVSVVVPIDKLSIVVTIAFSYIFFGEKLKKRSAAGLGLMVAGTLLMAILA